MSAEVLAFPAPTDPHAPAAVAVERYLFEHPVGLASDRLASLLAATAGRLSHEDAALCRRVLSRLLAACA